MIRENGFSPYLPLPPTSRGEFLLLYTPAQVFLHAPTPPPVSGFILIKTKLFTVGNVWKFPFIPDWRAVQAWVDITSQVKIRKPITYLRNSLWQYTSLMSSCAHYGYDITRIESINVGDGNRVSLKIIGQVDFSLKFTVLLEQCNAMWIKRIVCYQTSPNNRLARLLGWLGFGWMGTKVKARLQPALWDR